MEGEEVEAQWAGRVARPPLPRTEASLGVSQRPWRVDLLFCLPLGFGLSWSGF